MIHTYRLDGMHCGSCVARVQEALEQVEGVKKVIVSLNPPEAVVSMSHHLNTDVLNRAVAKAGGYALRDEVEVIDTMGRSGTGAHAGHAVTMAPPMPLVDMPNVAIGHEPLGDVSVTTYKPLLLIAAYLIGIVALVEWRAGTFDGMRAMGHFMAGFFLTFSFFKLLNVRDFASSYRMYDIVAKAVPTYGYAYPFIELALGVAYLTGWNPIVTNWATLIVMGVSLVGVVQSLLAKKSIRCACLGAVFNLPMSTVTVIEDGLMIAMAGAMLLFA